MNRTKLHALAAPCEDFARRSSELVSSGKDMILSKLITVRDLFGENSSLKQTRPKNDTVSSDHFIASTRRRCDDDRELI